jgi:hypothetical protein
MAVPPPFLLIGDDRFTCKQRSSAPRLEVPGGVGLLQCNRLTLNLTARII